MLSVENGRSSKEKGMMIFEGEMEEFKRKAQEEEWFHYNKRPKRDVRGMFKCNKPCSACPYIDERKYVKDKDGKVIWCIKNRITCTSRNIIYMLECKKDRCVRGKAYRYIGQSGRGLKQRLSDHRGHIMNKHPYTSIGRHFSLPGHSVSDLAAVVLEQVGDEREGYSWRREREKYHIREFDTHQNGLNKKV